MICPYCSGEDVYILETRHNDPEIPRRRRVCQSCNNRWTTREILSSEFDRLHAIEAKFNQIMEIFNR